MTGAQLVWFRTFTTQMIASNIVMWETRLSIVDWVSSKTQILLATLRTQNQPRGGEILCIFGSRTSVPITRMCKKQTSVSHSSTESEIISLDACLRMDGLAALGKWDVVIGVLHSSKNTTINPRSTRNSKSKFKKKRGTEMLMSCQVWTTLSQALGCRFKDGRYTRAWLVGSDLYKTSTGRPVYISNAIEKFMERLMIWIMLIFVSSSANSSRQEAMLYIIEDNEAVIKMIIKGRSPIVRHQSRTHKVALDWLFDRVNLDPKNPNQICGHQEPTCGHVDQR